MQFIKKVLNLKYYIPITEIDASDFLLLYWDNTTGTIIDTSIEKAYKKETDYITAYITDYYLYEFKVTISTPGEYKFAYKISDEIGNVSTLSAEETVDICLYPVARRKLTNPDYDAVNKTLTFNI